MRVVGLEGRSFIPLLSSYACAVPAIMAARTIENQRDRLATIFIAPFATCSARLPVYALLIAAFIEERPILGPFLGTRAAVLLGLYAVGFGAACLTAWLLKSTVLKSKPSPFMLQLPQYRWPTLRSLSLRLLDRSKVFLRRAGTVILVTTVVLWFLASVPYTDGQPPAIGDSLAGSIGKVIEPLVEPLGLNWKVGIGLITSMAAREVIVGTLGTIYEMEGDEDSPGLQEALRLGTLLRQRDRAADVLRVRSAMHVDSGHRPSRDRRLEVADRAIHLHARTRLRSRLRSLSALRMTPADPRSAARRDPQTQAGCSVGDQSRTSLSHSTIANAPKPRSAEYSRLLT